MADHDPNDAPWPEVDKVVQIRIAVYDAETDAWLMTRRGITHAPSPMVEMPFADLCRAIDLEVHGGLRAIQHRWNEEKSGG